MFRELSFDFGFKTVSFLAELTESGRVDTIYDFACGHGFLGVLLAYRFHKLKVVCVDLEWRPAFGHYLDIGRELGAELINIEHIESDFCEVKLSDKSYVICIHACNEATKSALEMTRAVNGAYAAMPCCIRDGIYIKKIVCCFGFFVGKKSKKVNFRKHFFLIFHN